MKRKSFTTQWQHQNVCVQYEGNNLLDSFFLKFFFKNWISLPKKRCKRRVIVKFGILPKTNRVNDRLFSYQREIDESSITTHINRIDWLRASTRSFYKTMFRNANVIGIPELYLAMIRKSILEPIEFYKHLQGWSLVHSSVFIYQDRTFVVAAGSKAGKSTLIKQLVKKHDVLVLSDNYAFLKDNYVKTIEEPMRGGDSKTFKPTFYGRSISGYPKAYESNTDFIIYLNRGEKNQIREIKLEALAEILFKINNEEQEGVAYLNLKDPLRSIPRKPILAATVATYELEISEGLENIAVAIDLILNLK
jgi:hypothetical protein